MFNKSKFTKEIAEGIMLTFEMINTKRAELEERVKKLEEKEDE